MDFNTITIHPKIEWKSDFMHGQLFYIYLSTNGSYLGIKPDKVILT